MPSDHPLYHGTWLALMGNLCKDAHHANRVGDEASLFFGEAAELKVPAGQIQTTLIVGLSDESYYLNMTGISLNGSILPIDSKLFTYEGDYGVAIDSSRSTLCWWTEFIKSCARPWSPTSWISGWCSLSTKLSPEWTSTMTSQT
ncbi:hypothetical protein L3X38_017225 [Prunus dulcis]|uniref:Uncharacterized protein n=1 Tax=Prunus dulcis TaxID=3755 RepID=A0AAD4W8E4_PRUDU|nr:hypothetical protein L3X38_017225 [Prunus dulcis]